MLTPQAKESLRKCIRGLRERLLRELAAEAERVYRLGVSLKQAKLSEERHVRRERLEAWLEEQMRTCDPKERKNEKALRGRFLEQAVKEAASTLLNRLVMLRMLEAGGLSKPMVVSGGWKSPGYREFQDYAPELCADAALGYETLLRFVFDELSLELPGLYGPVGLTQLFSVPPATLRDVVEALNDEELESAWTDDTTLGWIYQFWNDPERESLDAKINAGGKIEPHEIASKTQMFTERYMVEWLLQNSLGQLWLAMCNKHRWKADFEGVRDGLEQRRAEWRKKREAGEVALDALMPIQNELEERWKYWVPQPLPEDAPKAAPDTLRDLKLLDPACGSGHFLVIAFDLLAALYREESRHRGEDWSAEEIATSIVENNLHGVDIDPRAIQIAAAALWLKAKLFAPGAQLRRMNLVAPVFKLAALDEKDPARERLRLELEREVGIPAALTLSLVNSLKGVDHLGSLLRVDRSVEAALRGYEEQVKASPRQGQLFEKEAMKGLKLGVYEAKSSVLDKLGAFLAAHGAEQDLGLRLEGEQLAAGVRFVQMTSEGTYDLVVGNPPYQGTSKMAEAAWFKKAYPRGKADLYACFLERGLELAKPGGVSALLTMRGWMFLSQFKELREGLLRENGLQLLGDVDRGAFADIPDEVVAAVLGLFRKCRPHRGGVAVMPTPLEDKSRDSGRTARKRAALLCQVGRYEFDVEKLSGIEGTPLVYWWDDHFLEEYIKAPKLGDVAPVRQGLITGDNTRFLRQPWETASVSWVPFIKGAEGRAWCEPLETRVHWRSNGLEVKTLTLNGRQASRPQNEAFYFRKGIAVAMLGSTFSARVHRYESIFQDKGSSAFVEDCEHAVCYMNRSDCRRILEALNPTISFTISDITRLPIFQVESSREIMGLIEDAFTTHESHREPSVEFKSPGPSPWRYAQDWAQRAVDREKGAPLPEYQAEYDEPAPEAFVSFAIGVALGRFGANGEGILDPTNPQPTQSQEHTLPGGILFLAGDESLDDSLAHPAAKRIVEAWKEHSSRILQGKRQSLHEWLRRDFFKYHKSLYENRPIYFPLSSEDRSFVAFISIHRWQDNTLTTLLAKHLHPALTTLQGHLTDLTTARASSDKKAKETAEKQYSKTKKLFDELQAFIAKVTQCAEQGAPPTDAKCPRRDRNASYRMDLDDGVMINSAGLWPLLEPQWKDPKKWWKELCLADGRQDYDWSHLAARYFPQRVDEKSRRDPSLAVAHHCFWKYHPAKAYAWELRLQDEIKPDFTINEAAKADPLATSEGSDFYRTAFLTQHPAQARELEAKEQQRRERNRKKKGPE